jgi:hypothetical protein
VYFDNIMNHRGFDMPGYNSSAPTNLYPGLTVQDFHLRRQADGTYRNWDNISDWGNVWQVQHRPLSGLIDLANENGSVNQNFGSPRAAPRRRFPFCASRQQFLLHGHESPRHCRSVATVQRHERRSGGGRCERVSHPRRRCG